jgi:pimeloyl-ACP methyl ester carboxylesterase
MRSFRRRARAAALFGVAAALAVPAGALAQADYCEGDGGPAGAATDAEHSVLLGDPPLPAGVRSGRVDVGGVTTRYVEAGPPAARDAVVFVHGHPGTARDFDALVAAIGRYARVVAFDVSGYGASEKAARQVQSTAGAAGYLQGVLDGLGIRRAVLAPHDFGGLWGLHWAAEHPDALSGVVLIGTGVLIDYVPHPYAVTWATPGAGEAQMASTTRENFRATIQATGPRPLPEEFVERMYDGYDRATRCAALRYYRSASENLNAGREQAAILRRRSRPALVIWGERDPFIPANPHAERQREAFPDARVEVFPDSGHWPFIDNAERTHDLVVPFLRPRLAVARPGPQAARRMRVRVESSGPLPALRVRARVRPVRGGRASGVVGITPKPVDVSGARTLTLRLGRVLRPGPYELVVRARGLPVQRLRFAVR